MVNTFMYFNFFQFQCCLAIIYYIWSDDNWKKKVFNSLNKSPNKNGVIRHLFQMLLEMASPYLSRS